MIHGCLEALVREIVQQRATNNRSVLHNMSAGPNALASRKGADNCRRILFPLGAQVVPGDSLKRWCTLIGQPASEAEQAAGILREAASLATDRLMRLPPVATVLHNTSGQTLAGLSDDPLLTLAILSRSSAGKVFIRNKHPIILPEYLSLKVTLVVPENWSFEL